MYHLAEILRHLHDVVYAVLGQLLTMVLDVVFITDEPLLEVLWHSGDSSWCHALEGPFPIRKLEVQIVMDVTCSFVQLLDKPLHHWSDTLRHLQLCLDCCKWGIKGTPIFYILRGKCLHHLQIVAVWMTLREVVLLGTSGPGMKPRQLVWHSDK